MDTVIVTGGLGRSGRWVVDRLLADHEVVCVDRDHPGFGVDARDGLSFRACDLADRGAVFDLVGEIDPDAVVHWAAIPALGRHPEGDVLENNALGAFNVLRAAGRADADVVQASSDGYYGFFFAESTPTPERVPVPEDHPSLVEDGYGLSKVVAEDAAAAVARRHGIRVASVRPTWIQYPGDYPCCDDAYVGDLAAGAGNFWSYVDVRDVVDQVVAALDAATAGDFDGHEAFNCAAAGNALGEPLRELFERHYGTVPEPFAAEGDASVYDLTKAEHLLDWTPTRSWRGAADEEPREPTLYEE